MTGNDDDLPRPVGGGASQRSSSTGPRRASPTNPLGVKGVGETGTIAAPPRS